MSVWKPSQIRRNRLWFEHGYAKFQLPRHRGTRCGSSLQLYSAKQSSRTRALATASLTVYAATEFIVKDNRREASTDPCGCARAVATRPRREPFDLEHPRVRRVLKRTTGYIVLYGTSHIPFRSRRAACYLRPARPPDKRFNPAYSYRSFPPRRRTIRVEHKFTLRRRTKPRRSTAGAASARRRAPGSVRQWREMMPVVAAS